MIQTASIHVMKPIQSLKVGKYYSSAKIKVV